MRRRPFAIRTLAASVLGAAAAMFAAWLPAPPAAATGAPLTTSDVTQLVSRCVALSRRAPGRPKLAIAIVDAEGNSLGVFRMAGSSTDAVAAALAKAGTGAYFSSDEQTFSTRTAAFIIQDHFPPGVRFQPGGPLYGVEFSSLATTDVNRIFYPPFPAARGAEEKETRVRGDLGGIGLYRNGRRVGGLGIDDGDTRKRISIPPVVFPGGNCRADYRLTFSNMERGRVLEEIALAAARGWLAPAPIRSDRILVGGIRLPYSKGTRLAPRSAATVVPGVDGEWDEDFPLRPAASMTSRFEDFTLDPPAGAGPGAPNFLGQVPLAFPVRSSAAPGGLTGDDVRRILWQGAQRADVTRGAIRRPIGLPMQCWICVADVQGELLGAFRFAGDTTLFSFDVAAQKARTAAFFSDERAAFSTRAVGLLAQAFYPAGQQGAGRGPLFQLQDGLSVGLLGGAFGAPMPAEIARVRNGITIFPGGVPLYRDGVLVGGVGVSGDGVDQDDIVADFASRGFGAPREIRCDGLDGAQVKAALGRALARIGDAAGPDPGPGVCGVGLPLTAPASSFFHARLADAQRTLRDTPLETALPYTRFPRHPGPVTIRR